MDNNEVCQMLDTLYSELVSEIDIHCNGYLDESATILADAIKEAVKSTRNKLFGPDSE